MSEETQALFQQFIDDYAPGMEARRVKFIGRLAELVSQAGAEITQTAFDGFRGVVVHHNGGRL
jgi:hypothetical protein